MLLLEWIVPLLIGAVALTALAQRLGVPYPAFLALGGAVVALLPVGPTFALEPDLALALFVAPVLLDSAYDASLRDLRDNWLPITLLILAAVALTTAAVALVACWLLPDLPPAAAVALGAIVAPPDATAAMAILRQVRLPFRTSIILQGESLLNDASALFLYRIAVGATAAGAFHAGPLAAAVVLVLPASLLVGWGLSRITSRVVALIDDVPSSIICQFAFTFAIWMLAEALQLSAVLVIIAYAVALAQRPLRRFGARMRVPAFAVWETVTFTLNVLAFVLIGLQLRPILEGMRQDRLESALLFALAVLAATILARFGWVMSYQFVKGRAAGRFGGVVPAETTAASLKGGLIVSWCGMRGIVTLAAAFALPDGRNGIPAFPHRDLVLLTAFVVVLGTLVLQGLTLKPLLRWADLRDDDPIGREIGRARTEVIRAALEALDGEEGPAADALRAEYEDILRAADHHPDGHAPARTPRDELRLRSIGRARERLFELRAAHEIGNDAYGRVEAELDQAEMHASTV